MILIFICTLCFENQDTYQLTARPWGGVCAVPQFINSFDEDDARLEDNYIQGQQYTYSGEILKRSIDGKPLIYTVDVPLLISRMWMMGSVGVNLNMPPV